MARVPRLHFDATAAVLAVLAIVAGILVLMDDRLPRGWKGK